MRLQDLKNWYSAHIDADKASIVVGAHGVHYAQIESELKEAYSDYFDVAASPAKSERLLKDWEESSYEA